MFLCGVLGIVQGLGTYYHCLPLAFNLLIVTVSNFGGLVAVRFILGIVEAGIFPGCKFSNHILPEA